MSRKYDKKEEDMPENKDVPGIRKCLHCLKDFESFGSQNRICTPCKESMSYKTKELGPDPHSVLIPTSTNK